MVAVGFKACIVIVLLFAVTFTNKGAAITDIDQSVFDVKRYSSAIARSVWNLVEVSLVVVGIGAVQGLLVTIGY